MHEPEPPPLQRHITAPPTGDASLSEEEVWRLTLFKWRYALETRGFSELEVRYLVFHKWRSSRLAGDY